MWVLINEVIIFGIMLALIIGYFGGRGLGINKEVQFKTVVNSTVGKIKHNIKTGDSYNIERIISNKGNQKYIEYRIKLKHKKDGTKLTKQEMEQIVKSINSNSSNSNNNNSNNNNSNSNNSNNSNNNSNNNNTNTNSFTKNALVYYGWPSAINGANGNIQKAENEFKKYKIVILGNGVENPTFGDYNNTKKIIKDLKGKVKFYGYVPMIDGGNMTYLKVVEDINNWKYLGVNGIFIDEAGSDYWDKYVGLSYNDYKKYLIAINNYIKLKNMKVMYNSWIPEDIFNNLHLSTDDIVMIEDFEYANGIKKEEYVDHVTKYETALNKLSVKPKVYCLATATNNNQNKVNQIKTDIYKKMEVMCDYFDIQDDYGDDNNATVLTPTN